MTAIITPAAPARVRNLRDLADAFAGTRTPEEAAALARDVDREAAERGDELADAITTQVQAVRAATVDGTASTRQVRAEVTPVVDGEALPIADRIRLVAATPNGDLPLRVLPIAHDQLAERTKIPRDYWWRMVETQPDLAALNVNRWMEQEPDVRLFRMLRPITEDDAAGVARVGAAMNLRAVLGATYRPLDNGALVDTVLEQAHEAGAFVTRYDLDERRFHLRVTRPAVDVFSGIVVRTAEDEQRLARQHKIGEWVRMGFEVRNSEVGFAALSITPFCEVVRCYNGIIIAEKLSVRHVGKRELLDDEGLLGADTRRLDDAAVFLKVRDRIREVMGEAARTKTAAKIAEAAGTPLLLPESVPQFTFIENVGRRFDLSEAETRILQEEVVNEQRNDPNRLGFTKWNLSQAMTATARRVGDDRSKDAPVGSKPAASAFDRRVDLEKAGWTILTDATSDLMKAAAVAAAKETKAPRGARRN